MKQPRRKLSLAIIATMTSAKIKERGPFHRKEITLDWLCFSEMAIALIKMLAAAAKVKVKVSTEGSRKITSLRALATASSVAQRPAPPAAQLTAQTPTVASALRAPQAAPRQVSFALRSSSLRVPKLRARDHNPREPWRSSFTITKWMSVVIDSGCTWHVHHSVDDLINVRPSVTLEHSYGGVTVVRNLQPCGLSLKLLCCGFI